MVRLPAIDYVVASVSEPADSGVVPAVNVAVLPSTRAVPVTVIGTAPVSVEHALLIF